MSVNMNRKVTINVSKVYDIFRHQRTDEGELVGFRGWGIVAVELFCEKVDDSLGIATSVDIIMGPFNPRRISIHGTEPSDMEPMAKIEMFRKKIQCIIDTTTEIRHAAIRGADLDITRRLADPKSTSTAMVGGHRDFEGFLTWYITDCYRKIRYNTSDLDEFLEFIDRLLETMGLVIRDIDEFSVAIQNL